MAEQDAKPRWLAGRELGKALIDSGFIKPGDNVRRIIIDIHATKPVSVWIERTGDERVLSIVDVLSDKVLFEAQRVVASFDDETRPVSRLEPEDS